MTDTRNVAQLILVVEDDARTARLLARMLRDDGYAVELAFDGAAGLARLTRLPIPDVVVTDLRMPHADGAAIARYAQSRRPNLPIFLVTGHPELVADLERTLDPPPVVFTKPLNYEAFSAALRQAAKEHPRAQPPPSSA